MGRWRPPAAPTKPYITAAGFAALEQEAQDLLVRRREVVVHLSAAAAEGDRSENAEYQYRKKELREIDRRVGYLQRRMPKLKIVDREPADPTKVFFGARVTLEDEIGTRRNFRIVGGDEADAAVGDISVDSPVASTLLGKSLDDEVELNLLEDRARYRISAIDYGEDKR